MSSRSARPVKNEKGFFNKVKESIEDIITGPQGDLVTGKPALKPKTVKQKAKKVTPEAKTLKGRAEKQVIAAKAKSVNNNNIEPVKASKIDK